MNKDDIKKALECCSNPSLSYCSNCAYHNAIGCNEMLCIDALTLITEQEKEINNLKADYAKLQELFAQYQMASDKEIIAQKKEAEKRFENNMKSVLEIEKKQAVKDFAEKVKEEVYPFLQAEMYNKKHFITGDLISDKLLENQNIGILKAQDVLSKWFKVKIDELLKEYSE